MIRLSSPSDTAIAETLARVGASDAHVLGIDLDHVAETITVRTDEGSFVMPDDLMHDHARTPASRQLFDHEVI